MQTKNKPITSREMRALEANAEYYGISLLQLMENAGSSVAQEVIARFPEGKKVAVFCGLGGNGGDGFVAARHLLSAGYKVSVVLVGRSRDINHEAASKKLVDSPVNAGQNRLNRKWLTAQLCPKCPPTSSLMLCWEREPKEKSSRR